MTYFKNIDDLEQAKLQYRKLAKQLHPDRGGS
jgi:curved DNA-binding protein CbpA